jgi:ribosome biogenesis GTPase A
MAGVTGGRGRGRQAGSTWFPGEMAKTRRLIRENLSLVGLVIEVADARAPKASRHPGLAGLVPGRPILTVLAKADLADPAATRRWLDFVSRGKAGGPDGPAGGAIAFSSRQRTGTRDLVKLAAGLGRSRSPHGTVRAMVVGLPNVGKSTLINRLVGRASAKTGDRPGITRGKQWVRAEDGLDLLDLPGILVPGTIPPGVALILALLGILPGHVLDVAEVARYALTLLAETDRLPPEVTEGVGTEGAGPDLLTRFALARGHLMPGGVADLERAATAVVRAFREGRFGRLTLEAPGDPAGKGGPDS